MSVPAVPLEVVVSGALVPDGRLVLADKSFIAALSAVEKTIEELTITDAASAQSAATLQSRLTTAGKVLEDERVKLTAPFLAKQREIMEAAKAPALRITIAKKTLGDRLTTYAEAEKARLAKIEAERQVELARLEAKRLAELEAEQKRLADIAAKLEAKRLADVAAAAAAAAKLTVPVMDVDFGFDDEPAPAPVAPAPLPPTETEKAIAAIKYAPAPVVAVPTGVRFKTTLEYKVVDTNALADCFVVKTPKYNAIKTAFCDGWKEGQPIPECPGVSFEIKRTAQSTGR